VLFLPRPLLRSLIDRVWRLLGFGWFAGVSARGHRGQGRESSGGGRGGAHMSGGMGLLLVAAIFLLQQIGKAHLVLLLGV
jgi:hypothetical protein